MLSIHTMCFIIYVVATVRMHHVIQLINFCIDRNIMSAEATDRYNSTIKVLNPTVVRIEDTVVFGWSQRLYDGGSKKF
jgi:hypothetical protein